MPRKRERIRRKKTHNLLAATRKIYTTPGSRRPKKCLACSDGSIGVAPHRPPLGRTASPSPPGGVSSCSVLIPTVSSFQKEIPNGATRASLPRRRSARHEGLHRGCACWRRGDVRAAKRVCRERLCDPLWRAHGRERHCAVSSVPRGVRIRNDGATDRPNAVGGGAVGGVGSIHASAGGRAGVRE